MLVLIFFFFFVVSLHSSSLHPSIPLHIPAMPSSSFTPAGMTAAGFLYPAAMCAFLAKHGLSKGSLAPSGAVAATVVGMGTFTNAPYVFSTVLMTFYLSSSRMTKVGYCAPVQE